MAGEIRQQSDRTGEPSGRRYGVLDGERGHLHEIAQFFFSSRRRHTRCLSDWSSDVCSSDLRKFLRFLLSSNIGEVLTMFLGVVLGTRLGLPREAGGVALPLDRKSVV